MNTDFPERARPRITKKTVFLFVFTLIILAYISIPLIVLACGGDNNAGGGGNNKASSDAANATKEKIKKEKEKKDFAIKERQLLLLKEEQQIGKSVTKIPTASLTISDKQTIALLQNSARVGLQFTDILGHPVNISALKKEQRFDIKVGAKVLIAQFLGNNTARVALPSGLPIIIQFGPQPAAV